MRWSLVEPPEHLSQEHHAVGVGERDVIGRVKSVSRRLSRHREVADRRIAAPDLDDFILDESFLVGERQLLAYLSVDLFWGEENVEDGRYRVGPLSSGSKSWKTPANGLKRCWFEERSVSPGINGGCSSPRSRWKCARAIRVRQNAASGGDARPSPRGFANSGQACAGSRQVGRLGDPGQKSLDCEANGHQGHQGVGNHQRRQFGPHKATMTRTGSPQRPTIGLRIEAGDALAIEGETSLELKGISVADMILFDLA